MAEPVDMDDKEALAIEIPLPALRNARPRRLRSLVWNDFTKQQKVDGNYEAICNHCCKKFTANSRSGTTHLRNHLNSCLSTTRTDGRKRGRKPRAALKSPVTVGDDRDGQKGSQFDQELSRMDLSRMIILHRYPFSIVHHHGFQAFIRNLQPRFHMPTEEIIKADCMMIYDNERIFLSGLLGNLACRVSITIDRWESSSGGEYVCLAGHFVGDDWKLQSKMLNLLHFEVPPTAEEVHGSLIEKLHDWNISRKLFCMVFERSRTDHVGFGDILLKSLQTMNMLPLNGTLFHAHGCAQTLDAIARDALIQVGEICEKVRSCVKFTKSSQEKLKRFQNAAVLAQAPQKLLVLDVNCHWRSTYLMLATAYEFRVAFKHLEEYDPDFSTALSCEEWEDVKSVKECLETFDHLIKKFSAISEPTSSLYFIDICSILLLLKSWSISPVPIIVKLASHMLKDFEEYWNANATILAIASILDPRYKMKSTEYFFKNIHSRDYEAKVKIDMICDNLRNLYNEYVHSAHNKSDQALLCSTSSTGCADEECTTSGGSQNTSQITLSDTRKGLDQYLQQTLLSQTTKSDLDLYLEEAVHICKDGPEASFDVLSWWKFNAAKFPILSSVARDVLSVPLGIVGTRTEERSLSQYWSSLDPVTLQGMMCVQDWLKNQMEARNLDEDACLI
ncbi:Putative AC transposase [Apostasia shenzhenica]|uniref:AC transposase n=1 Tax=Apostasia shenzhenica TaxID=1088818 RepID=A0A2I0AUA3_9ASPA|nr:Putative AC transposase [Apostasia shenzhenica]